eukprot:12430377-Alexandrium_andersonii.AAC.1
MCLLRRPVRLFKVTCVARWLSCWLPRSRQPAAFRAAVAVASGACRPAQLLASFRGDLRCAPSLWLAAAAAAASACLAVAGDALLAAAPVGPLPLGRRPGLSPATAPRVRRLLAPH